MRRRRQSKFRPIETAQDFVSRLKDEISAKNIDHKIKVGFLNG